MYPGIWILFCKLLHELLAPPLLVLIFNLHFVRHWENSSYIAVYVFTMLTTRHLTLKIHTKFLNPLEFFWHKTLKPICQTALVKYSSYKIFRKDGVWVGHMLSGYSLLMEDPASLMKDPGEAKEPANSVAVGGTWRETIRVAFETTKLAFPGGEVLAHLDHK